MSVNRFVASQRRELNSQQSHLRPGKVPYRDPYGDDANRNRPSTTNNDETRKKLQTLLVKEKNKEKLEKVQQVIVQRYAMKFGSKHIPLISFFVEEHLTSHSGFNEGDLVNLEKEIGEAIRSKVDNFTLVSQRNRNNNTNQTNEPRPQTSSQNNVPENSASEMPSRPPSGKEWLAIQMYQSFMDEEKIKQEKLSHKQKQQQFKSLLDQQRQEAARLQTKEREEDRQYAQIMNADVNTYLNEEQQKKILLKQKYHEELLKQQRQIAEQQKRHEDERQAKLIQEEYNLSLAKSQLQQEAEKQRQLREIQRSKHAKMKLENDENRKMRILQKEQEAQETIKMMQEYEIRLEREERQREELFQKKLHEMEHYAKKYENEGAGKQQREERNRIEAMIVKEQARKEKLDEEKEILKKHKQKENLQKQMEENAHQLEYKQYLLEHLKHDDVAMREKYEQEIQAYQKEMKEKEMNRRKAQHDYKDTLDIQLNELKHIDYKLVNITSEEKKINQPILSTLASDQTVLQEVLTRMGATTTSRSANATTTNNAAKRPF